MCVCNAASLQNVRLLTTHVTFFVVIEGFSENTEGLVHTQIKSFGASLFNISFNPSGASLLNYPEVLFKALTLLVNIL